MPETSAPAKICVHCGQDCSAKPRTKDGQGRYLCRECLDKLRAKSAPAQPAAKPKPAAKAGAGAVTPPPVADEGSVLSTLLADAPDPCPGCTAPMPKGALICAFCGFNKQSGEATRTRISRAHKEKKEKSAGPGFQLNPWTTFGITAVVMGALCIAGVMNPALAMLAVMLIGLIAGVLFWVTVIFAFIDNGVGWGLACLIVPFASLYWALSVTGREHIRALTLATFLGWIMAVIVLVLQISAIMQEAPTH